MFADLSINFGDDHQHTRSTSRFERISTVKKIDGAVLKIEFSKSGHELYHHVCALGWDLWSIGELYELESPKQKIEQVLTNIINKLTTTKITPIGLNGHFILFGYHKETHTWHVWTNRFGTLHAYYANNGSHAAIGTFASAVAATASSRQIDWEGLAGFCAWGFFPQDRTHFADMRILRPATHYHFDKNGRLLGQERYWQWHHKPNLRRSYDETLVELDTVLRTVLGEQLTRDRVAVPISGGLDSRTTVALVPSEAPQELWAYSYGYGQHSVETKIARRIAHTQNLRFDSYSVKPYLFDQLSIVLACLEGFQDVTQARQATVTHELATNADYVIAAHWGDVWFDTMGLLDSAPGDHTGILEHAVHKFEKRGRQWLLDKLCFSQLSRQDIEETLRSMLRAELDGLRHIEEADFRIKALKTNLWSARWTTASLRMYQAAAFPRLPFYDTRVADFFSTVPSAWLKGRKLQIDYLKRFAPDLARITWQPYDANLYRYQNFNSWQLPKRTAKKLWRTLSRSQPVTRNWEVQFLSPEGRQGLAHHLLRPGLRLHELVALRDLNVLIDDFYRQRPDGGQGYTLSMLLTIASWLEQYG